ncbi:SufS family cysteine desulfurase [Thalassotalea sp. ND16A]|uniref:SufS family cysteine desulfurase n=1 Tax=Thalassotalea sp. ND16A TaxID=1535422 RepID=UPI00051A655C|nr:SufS family cysteine desulfurase [Thalassotalea sp. ND16A]KGJ96704.1 Cysteine desulfurase [Thalassotalea sp. ND16A]
MRKFSVSAFRQKFPILQTVNDNHKLIYFDNAATTQKPQAVITSSANFYQHSNANVHRASHFLSAKATMAYEQAREQSKAFINAKSIKEIIWSKGTTEAINLVAHSYGMNYLNQGDEIVVSLGEHHANIVPWQHVAAVTGAKLVVLPLNPQGRIDLTAAKSLISKKCKFLAINHISNVLGKINPVEELIKLAKQQGAITLIDGAQAIAHLAVDVQALDCDFYVFSAHKMFGPTGLGVLYGKQALLEKMPPYQFGGEMIKKVSFSGTSYNVLPHKFEAGTPNIVAVVGFGACLHFFENIHHGQMASYEQQLIEYAFTKLSEIKPLKFLANGCPDIPVFSFTLQGFHHQDAASFLDSKGIAVRSGHHCAMPLMESLELDGSVRVSLAAYNTFAEVDYVVEQLHLFCSAEAEHTNEQLTDGEQTEVEQVIGTSAEFITADEVLALFSKARSWDLKHREIMLLSKQLVRLDKSIRNDNDLISGCESKAWLQVKFNRHTKQLTFQADSDAKVIRGLMVIILSVYQQKTGQQIIGFDIEEYFSHLGLMQHLSPSRGNGVKAIVERIKQIAYNYQ